MFNFTLLHFLNPYLMYFLIYSSYASHPFSDIDLQTLLMQSREANAIHGLTGLLYYFHDSFVQLIEGDEIQVQALYQRIRRDVRHQFPVILKEGHHDQRFFPDWTMGYKVLDASELKNLRGRESGHIDPAAVLRLLKISG